MRKGLPKKLTPFSKGSDHEEKTRRASLSTNNQNSGKKTGLNSHKIDKICPETETTELRKK